MTARDEGKSIRIDDEERVVVHAQKGSTVAITLTENHYHYPEWLTPDVLVELAKVICEKRGDRGQ